MRRTASVDRHHRWTLSLARPFETFHRRWSGRSFEAFSFGAWLSPALLAFLTILCVGRYFRLSPGQYWSALAIDELAIAITSSAAAAVTYRKWRELIAWTRSDRSSEPAQHLWDLTTAFPRDATIVWGTIDTVIAVPAGALAITAVKHLPIADAGVILLALLVAQLFLVLFCLFGSEVAMVPVARDLARRLPHSALEPSGGLSVELKLFFGLLALVLMSSFFVGSFAVPLGSGVGSLAAVIGITFAFSLSLSLLIAVLVSDVVLRPVRDLLRGTRAVGRGDLNASVAVVSNDEFGRLAASFNQMVDDLRDRAEQLRASRARIIEASDAERRRVERNIHDGAQQQLVALAVRLRMLEDRTTDVELQQALGELTSRLKAALDNLRELARGLHPSVLTTDGLQPALEQLALRTPLPVSVQAPDHRFPEAVESTAYFVACEALANVVKYARATHANVSVERRDSRLVISVADDGIGGANAEGGSGLTGLVDRVAALEGQITVDSPTGSGTNVIAEIPLP